MLQDVAVQLGLPVDGEPLTGSLRWSGALPASEQSVNMLLTYRRTFDRLRRSQVKNKIIFCLLAYSCISSHSVFVYCSAFRFRVHFVFTTSFLHFFHSLFVILSSPHTPDCSSFRFRPSPFRCHSPVLSTRITSEFARKWVPLCKKYSIEPRAPKWYFALKIDYLKDKVQPSFVKERRTMKV
ncbi:uncharacterized protein LOC127149995 [Cucumis melo]|uniref:Uncharacterized protein LOC127149995 n=1 Tax=Cucumis melo TaxID=3656 RepID=A0ABM3KXR3_CUCME|nr:uncharacterized protein LOC127149995 [Cucumis melo]